MLFFRGSDWQKHLLREQLRTVFPEWATWFERLIPEGKCTGGHPLNHEGTVSGKNGALVMDGAFAEFKEAIGDYFYPQHPRQDMSYSILWFLHLVGTTLIAAGLIGVWYEDLRSRQIRDLLLFAETVRQIAVFYDGMVVPGAILLLGSGSWPIVSIHLNSAFACTACHGQ